MSRGQLRSALAEATDRERITKLLATREYLQGEDLERLAARYGASESELERWFATVDDEVGASEPASLAQDGVVRSGDDEASDDRDEDSPAWSDDVLAGIDSLYGTSTPEELVTVAADQIAGLLGIEDGGVDVALYAPDFDGESVDFVAASGGFPSPSTDPGTTESTLWEIFETGTARRVTATHPPELVVPGGEAGIARIIAGEDTSPDEIDTAPVRTVAAVTPVVASFQRRVADLERQIAEHTEEAARLQEFADIVAHDLRNPLSVASGYLEIAAESGDREAFDKVRESHDRIERIIQHTLSMAKEGTSAIEPEPVAVPDVVRRAWTSIVAPGATLSIEVSRTVDADPDRLQQLFENLFRNAVEHGSTDPGSGGSDDADPTVTVTVGELDDGFYVADDGRGIPPEERESVFERGYTSNADGTGIGLAVVREITEEHGWDVTVTTSADGGAQFEVRTAQSRRTDAT